ncbi:MAG: sugar ABC transporter substrate-binding protein [Thermomicrobiales bacterium]
MNRVARSVAALGALALFAAPAISTLAQDATPAGGRHDIEIAYVLHGLNSFTEDMVAGAQDAANDYGVSLRVFDDASFDVSVELDEFESALQGGYDGIAVAPLEGERWIAPIQQAAGQGVPVVGFNVTSLDSALTTWVGQDDYGSGQTLGREMARQLGAAGITGGDIAVGSCNPDENVLQDRDAGLRAAFVSTPFTLLDTQDVHLAIPENATAWEAVTAANPEIVAAIGLCYIDAPKLAEIKQRTGASWLIGGYNLDAPAAEAISSGTAQVVIDQQEYLQGYLPVAILAEHLMTGAPLATGWIETPVEVVNSETIGAFSAREDDDQAQRTYYRAYIDAHFPNLREAARPYGDLQNLGEPQATPAP